VIAQMEAAAGSEAAPSATPPSAAWREDGKPWNHLDGREGLPGIAKVSYSHDAMIDLLIANPRMSQGEIAMFFGYTQPWVSLIMSSDAFRIRMEARKNELVDPTIRSTIEERFRALATKSLEVLQRKLESPNVSDNLAVQAATLAARSLGLGNPRNEPPPPIEPDRLERLGGRLLALLGNRVAEATRTLDYEIIDTPHRALIPSTRQDDGEGREVHGSRPVPSESAPDAGGSQADPG
jgi:hypothetical protein